MMAVDDLSPDDGSELIGPSKGTGLLECFLQDD
jgi:hypothetical protein